MPRASVFLAAPPKRAPPDVDHIIPERQQRPDVRWDSKVRKVPGHDLPQPLPLFGNWPVTVADNRLFVEAVLYRYRTGTPWRDLPERFGDGTKVHLRFSRQARNGVWERVFQYLAADADNEYAMIDVPLCAPINIAPAPKKSPGGPGDRTLARRAEHQDPYTGRRAGQPGRLLPDRRRGARPHGCRSLLADDGGRYADRR